MPFKGWKTIAFNVITLLSLVGTAALGSPDVVAWLHANAPALVGTLSGINIVLRVLTSTPIFKSS